MQLPQIIPTQKYQIALFPSDLLGFGVRNWNKLFTELLSIEEFSNGANTLLSTIPPDAPQEIPRIILKSNDGTKTCTVSPAKVDIFWENLDDNQEFSVSLDERKILTNKVAVVIGNSFKRVGSIQFFYFTLPVGQIDPIRTEIFQENSNIELRDYNLSLTYNVDVPDAASNWVLNLSNGKLNTTSENVVLVMADLNTHQDTVLTWSPDQVISFLDHVETYISKEKVFDKLFPLK